MAQIMQSHRPDTGAVAELTESPSDVARLQCCADRRREHQAAVAAMKFARLTRPVLPKGGDTHPRKLHRSSGTARSSAAGTPIHSASAAASALPAACPCRDPGHSTAARALPPAAAPHRARQPTTHTADLRAPPPTTRLLGGELRTSSETKEVRFVPVAQLDELNIHPSMRLRIEHYLQGRAVPYIG